MYDVCILVNAEYYNMIIFNRTDTEYEDSLIVKLFAFNFVNSYASLLFIAFIKSNVEPCNGSCFVELSFQLTFIFGKF